MHGFADKKNEVRTEQKSPNYLKSKEILLLSAVSVLNTFVEFVACSFVANGFCSLVLDSDRLQNWLLFGLATAFVGRGAKLALSEN